MVNFRNRVTFSEFQEYQWMGPFKLQSSKDCQFVLSEKYKNLCRFRLQNSFAQIINWDSSWRPVANLIFWERWKKQKVKMKDWMGYYRRLFQKNKKFLLNLKNLESSHFAGAEQSRRTNTYRLLVVHIVWGLV